MLLLGFSDDPICKSCIECHAGKPGRFYHGNGLVIRCDCTGVIDVEHAVEDPILSLLGVGLKIGLIRSRFHLHEGTFSR